MTSGSFTFFRFAAIFIIEFLFGVNGLFLLVIMEPPSFIKIMIFNSAMDGFKKYITKMVIVD